MNNISFNEFKKMDIRIGEILSTERIDNSDNLLRLEVDFGDFKRQIVTGIAKWYEPKDLIDKKVPFIVNLEPRIFRGIESQGMLVAVDGEDQPVLLEPQKGVKAGDKIV